MKDGSALGKTKCTSHFSTQVLESQIVSDDFALSFPSTPPPAKKVRKLK